MVNFIKKVPIPLSGVMLGMAALGNLLQSYSESLRYVCGIISFIMLIFIILKIIMFPDNFKEDMKNPVIASVSPTFPMGIMLLSVYANPFIGEVSKIIWLLAILLHIVLIIYFTYKFIFKFDIKKVFASYFVVYVGIAVAALTSSAYGMQEFGKVIFYFSFVMLLVLLAIVGYRYIKYPELPEPTKPLFCIFTAPVSLCLAAYMQAFSDKNYYFVCAMAILSTLLYTVVVIRLFTILRISFYPSYAAFTFPFVISATAMKLTAGYFNAIGSAIPFMSGIVFFETVIAALIVSYAVFRFILFLVKK